MGGHGIRHYLSGMDSELRSFLDEFRGNFKRIDATLEQFRATFDDFRGNFNRVDATLEEFRANFKRTDATFDDFRGNFAQVNTRLDEFEERVAKTHVRFERYFELIYGEITGLKTRLSLVEVSGRSEN